MSEMIKTIGGKKLLADYNTEGKKLALKEDALTAGDNITIENNMISSDQLFIAEYGKTAYNEVKAAYDAGKICYCKYSNNTYGVMYAYTPSNIRFVMTNPVAQNVISWNVNTNNTWSAEGFNIQSKLTFDSTPTLNSTNPVTSKGIYSFVKVITHPTDSLHVKDGEYYSFLCKFKAGAWDRVSATFTGCAGDSSNIGEFNFFGYLGTSNTELHTAERMNTNSGFVYNRNYAGVKATFSKLYDFYIGKNGDYFYVYTKYRTSATAALTVMHATIVYASTDTMTDKPGEDVADDVFQTMTLYKNEHVYINITDADLEKKQDKLTAGTGISIDDNVISASGSGTLFMAVYGETSLADISAAFNAGQIVQCKYSNVILQLSAINNIIASFTRPFIANNAMKVQQAQCNADGWTISNT